MTSYLGLARWTYYRRRSAWRWAILQGPRPERQPLVDPFQKARARVLPGRVQPSPPGDWLEDVDIHLAGEAAQWPDRSPIQQAILKDNYAQRAPAAGIEMFKRLQRKRFDEGTEGPLGYTIPAIQAL